MCYVMFLVCIHPLSPFPVLLSLSCSVLLTSWRAKTSIGLRTIVLLPGCLTIKLIKVQNAWSHIDAATHGSWPLFTWLLIVFF